MVLDIHLFANKPKDSQIALAVGFFISDEEERTENTD